MEIIRELNVPASSFMKHIKASLRYELDQNNHKNLKAIEGVEYTKPMSNRLGSSSEIKVKVVTLNECEYRGEYYYNQGITISSYEVEAMDNNRCKVIYREEFKGANNTKQWNYKLMSILYKRRNLRRVHALLTAIEEHLKNEEESHA